MKVVNMILAKPKESSADETVAHHQSSDPAPIPARYRAPKALGGLGPWFAAQHSPVADFGACRLWQDDFAELMAAKQGLGRGLVFDQ